MITQDYEKLDKILDSICNSKNNDLLVLSKEINNNIDIFIDALSKIQKPYNINLSKLIQFLQQHIKNLSNEISKYKVQKESYDEEIEKTNKMINILLEKSKEVNEKFKNIYKDDNIKKEIIQKLEEKGKKRDEDIINLNEKLEKERKEKDAKIESLKENVKSNKKEIENLKIEKGRLEIKNENLMNKFNQSEKINKKIQKEFEEYKEQSNNEIKENKEEIKQLKLKISEKNFEKLNEDFLQMKKDLCGIKNRDNYKSIIYIFLISCGNNFKDIAGKVQTLINQIGNRNIKEILDEAYLFYDESRYLAHSGYNKEIMKKLFPNSRYVNMINDDLINNIKNLIKEYEIKKSHKNSSNENEEEETLEEKNKLDKTINNITNQIISLKLNIN